MGFSKCCYFPVLVFLSLLLMNYYIILFVFVRPWISLRTFLRGMIFTALNIMILISHGLAVLRDPGQVPLNYLPDLETSPNPPQKAKELKFCDKCGQYKPGRAHHCRICKRCVLRMDHHCAWINNCVGHRNYKAFLLLVFYLFLGCLYSLSLYGGSSLELRSSFYYLKLAYGFSLCVGVFIFFSMLAWNFYLLSHNKTTIEFYQAKRERWIAEKAGQTYRHPYDLGLTQNLINVLGPKTNYWLCPMSVGHIGSGLWSKTYSDNNLNTETS